jgi:hypothetical protein
MPTTKITKAKVEAVRQAIAVANGVDPTAPWAPKIIHNWDWTVGGVRWAIVWEEGPDAWAMDTWNVPVPSGTFLEPVTSWAVGLYVI